MTSSSDRSLTNEQMTDIQYRDRFISRLTERLETDGHMYFPQALALAKEIYEDCPRNEMLDAYAANPEKSANEAYCEWDDGKRYENVEEYEDGEDDEDWDDGDDDCE